MNESLITEVMDLIKNDDQSGRLNIMPVGIIAEAQRRLDAGETAAPVPATPPEPEPEPEPELAKVEPKPEPHKSKSGSKKRR